MEVQLVSEYIVILIMYLQYVLYAGNGVDYNSGLYRIVFSPGMTKVLLEVVINDDGVSEESERFRLVIDKNSLPSDITIGKYRRAAVTIFG